MSATHDFKCLSTTDNSAIRELLRGAMTDQINDREIFMKGIDYSYYYEQEDQQQHSQQMAFPLPLNPKQ